MIKFTVFCESFLHDLHNLPTVKTSRHLPANLLELFQCPHFASKAINIFLVEVQKYFLVNPNFFASGVISKYYAHLNTERNRSFEIGTNEGESMLSDD